MNETLLDLWVDTAKSLTIEQAADVLSKLHQGYSQHNVSVLFGTASLEGSFTRIAVFELHDDRRWYNIRCRFHGGPDGGTEMIGTLGTFVADCFMREVIAGRETCVWEAYHSVFAKDSVEQIRIRV